MTDRLAYERLGVLLSSLADAVAVGDQEGRIVLANESFSRVFGLTGEPCSGAQEIIASRTEDPESFANRVKMLLSDRSPVYKDEVILKDGTTLLRDYLPIVVAGEYEGHLWRYVDVTEVVNSRKELERHLIQLKQVNRSLHDFNRVVSHELKAPLRRIMGFTHVLREEFRSGSRSCGDDGAIEEALGFIEGGITQMETVISTLHKFTHLESQGINLAPVDLGGLLEEVLGDLGDLGSRATFVLGTDFPVVLGDRVLLRQVAMNLITNGIKYNESEEPTVKIRHVPSPSSCRIEIEDNGIGIKEQDLDHLFGMFRRFYPRVEGNGIGLALARKIIEAHEGQIGVVTEFGLGSTFWFSLPLANQD